MNNNEWMTDMNCPMMNNMYQQPMMMQPEMDMNRDMEMDMHEEHLKSMYPEIYLMIMPLVKHHCNMHEQEHGKMHCPEHEHVMKMRDSIYEEIRGKLDEDLGEEEEEEDDENRIRRYGRRGAVRDLVGILLLNELIGRRRRRRRRPRPRPHYGWY